MDTEEEEDWKTYPEYDFIEASNLGRIRTKDRYVMRKDGRKQFVKGHILKQLDNGHGYMRVQFGVGCKKVDRYVHRIIASAFIPNPDNLPQVNHKDNNRANNVVGNLEWCSRQYNETYKKNFGTSQTQLFGKQVFAVNLETGKVLRFKSQGEAARQLGISDGGVNRALKGRLRQAGGYLFTKNTNEITKDKLQEIRNNIKHKAILAINLETQKVLYFKSQRETSRQLRISRESIRSVLKGQRNQISNYYFCYVDENTIKKVREKFGDKLGNEVKELMKKML